MNKGTILYVGNFELPDKGASANRVMTNRLLFREIGYRTVYLGVTREAVFSGVRKASFDNNVFERAYPSSAKMWLERSYSLKDIIAVAEQHDEIKFVIFYNSPYSLVKKAYGYFSKMGIKILYDCTEWNPYTKGNKLKQLYKKFDAYQIQHNLERHVDGLIVISSLMYQQYQLKPKVLIPPLVDIMNPMWQQKRTRDDGVFEFCYAGDPENKDDLCRLINAFVKLNGEPVRLVIMGVTEEDFLQEHPEYKDTFDTYQKNLCLTGRVSHEKVIHQLINTDCFVFIRESNLRNNAGFPTKFAEAYTSGARVIATDVSDISYYKDETIQVLSEIHSSTIIKAMLCVLEEKRANTIRNAFDYRSYVKNIKDFIEPIAEEARRRQK